MTVRLDGEVGGPADYLRSAREIRSQGRSDLRSVRLAVLSTSTAEMLDPYIVVEGARRGLGVEPAFLPYGQVETVILDGESTLYRSRPDVVLIMAGLSEVAPRLLGSARDGRADGLVAEVEHVERWARGLISALRDRSDGVILLSNFEPPDPLVTPLADVTEDITMASAVQSANEAVARVCAGVASAFVFDIHRVATELGSRSWRDPKLWSLGRIPFSARAQVAIGARIARYLRALVTPRRKCLVLDLDGVLWGGVLGEEGIGGIALGEDFPGNTYKTFQRELLALRSSGIMLAIASKNNPEDVREAFEKHPDMVLKFEDLSAVEVHWGDKAESLRSIARKLNIGIDALALFDDAPTERERIRRALPDVEVIDVPESSVDYWAAIERAEVFDTLVVSAEDRVRATAYARDESVQSLGPQFESVDDFLRSLDLSVRLGEVDDATLPRVEQLMGKTNQFNLTSRRHTAAQIRRMVADGAVALWARVSDRFGDSGLTGVAVARPFGEGSWTIDSFLLSCRVIGRRVERVLLAELAAAVEDRGGRVILGEYIPTSKNAQVADFYPAHGFAAVEGRPGMWALHFPAPSLASPPYISVVSARAGRAPADA